MSGTTVTAAETIGLTLNSTTDNPVLVTRTGAIVSASTDAIYGAYVTGETWTVTNIGTLGNTGSISNTPTTTSYYGVVLEGGGIVTNGTAGATGALIYSEGAAGVRIDGSVANVANGGSIAGALGIYTSAPAYVANTGTIAGSLVGTSTVVGSFSASGVVLDGGGTLVNGSTGNTIAGITGSNSGVYGDGASTTVINLAQIAGGTAGFASGILVNGVDGHVVNGNAANAVALISGGQYGVALDGASTLNSVSNCATIVGYNGISAYGGTVTNRSTVIGTGSIGVNFYGRSSGVFDGTIAGVVVNGASGNMSALISGPDYGISLYGNSALNGVENYGTITGDVGVSTYGGAVTNAGTISGEGYAGVAFYGTIAGVVVNGASGDTSALVSGTKYGVYFTSYLYSYSNKGTVVNSQMIGTVSNYATIAGGIGVKLTSGGTIRNAGTVDGTYGTAVKIDGSAASRVIVAPGAVFGNGTAGGAGIVAGSSDAGASNTLELASAVSVGTLTGLGTQFLNFSSIVFDAGARWSIAGNSVGLAGTISGFGFGDTIEITGATASKTALTGDTLELSGGLDFVLPGNAYTYAQFQTTNSGGNTDLTVACFAAGTRISTPDGHIPVEELRIGDVVLAHDGVGAIGPRPIIWIGHRALDCRCHPTPELVWPVRIVAAAFGPGQPARDLWLSPDHAVFVGGALIPVRYLINGGTVARVAVAKVTYFHIELAAHAVLLAEGLPGESYLDTGNRAAFANGGNTAITHPDVIFRI